MKFHCCQHKEDIANIKKTAVTCARFHVTFARLAVDEKSRFRPIKTRLLVQVSMATDVHPHSVDTLLHGSTDSFNPLMAAVNLITDCSKLD